MNKKQFKRSSFYPKLAVPYADHPEILEYQIEALIDRFLAVNGASGTNLNSATGAMLRARTNLKKKIKEQS